MRYMHSRNLCSTISFRKKGWLGSVNICSICGVTGVSIRSHAIYNHDCFYAMRPGADIITKQRVLR